MEGKKYVKTAPDIVFREEDGGAFLFNSNNCSLKGINDTGKLIWGLCDGTRTREEICSDLAKQFLLEDTEQLEKDVREFIEELNNIGYVREEE